PGRGDPPAGMPVGPARGATAPTGRPVGGAMSARAGWAVVAVIDCAGQAQTAAAVGLGLARFRADVTLAGVILNRVASARHEALVRAGFASAGIPVLGALPRRADVTLPARHLGLVQAEELPRLDATLAALGTFVAAHCDLTALRALAGGRAPPAGGPPVPPPGERIALARDAAFSFIYPHLLADWRAAGATILPFSPLQDAGPDPSATVCWLPGGYPELHAGALAAAEGFRAGLAAFARTRPVHGECGGYMALGAGLVAADGTRHRMAGLLGLETSFATRRMHLGYRLARPLHPLPGLGRDHALRGHEFHYATILAQPDPPLAAVEDATGAAVAETGSCRGTGEAVVSGSFFHLIDLSAAPAG
ncbi:cobyrinate a,c-diamide synthase, partial [Paracoccus sanguinis]|uniref:cobyrinate a,c-diamide synthase n=1 Tax=Paracoccus sanguinis TaxID=1545044 RepID=UPI0012E013CB